MTSRPYRIVLISLSIYCIRVPLVCLFRYSLEDTIGTGSFGTVRKCRDKSTGELFACKTIRKDRVEDPQVLRNEIDLLAQVRHPHIIQLMDVYEDLEHIHIVTELCTGGELYDRVVEKAESEEKHFEERDAARIIRDILDAIAYCHSLDIVHRDLKPENFLLKDESDDAEDVKIIDFGLSRKDDKPYGIMSSRVGTYYTCEVERSTVARCHNHNL
jgi:calcium-dependent protein kinase